MDYHRKDCIADFGILWRRKKERWICATFQSCFRMLHVGELDLAFNEGRDMEKRIALHSEKFLLMSNRKEGHTRTHTYTKVIP